MNNFQILSPGDLQSFQLIADWWLDEWKMPREKSLQRLQDATTNDLQFHVLMTINGVPVSTGGVHSQVGLHYRVPRFKIYPYWLALVYTKPEYRKNGYGVMLCKYIQDHARKLGIDELYLFTDTAEPFYERLGWEQFEAGVLMGERIVTVMRTSL